ncbi:PBP1A family penicillin-binding protein [Neobacillus sp. LXY-4]|uniref:PBP1A family penicillin-binding protein n=1 Tax=Neobacillus sp. LXY-4 TaxID=3379826 RepID=UPI003EDEF8F3
MSGKYQSREERKKQQNNGKTKPKGKKTKQDTIKKVFLILVALGIVGILSGVAVFAYMVKDAPKLDESALKDPIPSEIYDKNGELITEVGSVNRDYVEYEEIPKLVENAFLATEDVRFYKHNGVDLIRLGGAVIANITDGFGSEGASTITQQVVKNSFLTPEKTISRKVQEAWLAYQLERKYTKHEIFEMYVNKIWMSENSHGVKTAAKIYFGKPLDQLELHEAALLAGMPQSPENYNPFKYPDRAEKRRNIVLSLMHQHGFISKEDMEQAQQVPVESTLVSEEKRNQDKNPHDSFVDQVIDEVEKKYGDDLNIFSDGLKIYTTLDKDAQTYVETMLNSNEIVQFPDEQFQAGITLLDTKTGEIRAIGGGRNQKVQRGFNFATDSKRQPGSTIKPILDYGPAIEYLKWGTYYPLEDKPMKYSDGTPVNNWNNTFLGTMSMRVALGMSRNIPAIQTLQAVGLPKAQAFAQELGIPLPEILESYAIGGLKKGVSSLQMAGAYSAFGNNGIYTEPYAVKEIELRDGTKIKTTPESKVVMKDYTAFMITDMLKSVVRDSYGTGRLAGVPGLQVAGKTGTTNYDDATARKFNIPDTAVPDAWFVGYTTNYTAAVWTGYENRNTYIPAGDNQKIAQKLFKNLMTEVSKDIETPDFPVPKTVQKVAIEKGTSKLASEFTPKDQIIYEYAVKGSEPKEVSKKYTKLDTPVSLNAKYDQTGNSIILSWDYPQENSEGVQFEVSVSINEGADQVLKTTTEKGLNIANPVAGGMYTFKVSALRDGQRSDPIVTTIVIPDKEKDKDKDEQGNNNEKDQNDNDTTTDEEPANTTPGTTQGENNTGTGSTQTPSTNTSGTLPSNGTNTRKQ